MLVRACDGIRTVSGKKKHRTGGHTLIARLPKNHEISA